MNGIPFMLFGVESVMTKNIQNLLICFVILYFFLVIFHFNY